MKRITDQYISIYGLCMNLRVAGRNGRIMNVKARRAEATGGGGMNRFL